MVGNHTRAESFYETLKPFFDEMLRNEVGGICSHEHIIVFEEKEQTESPTAYEIMLSGDYYDESTEIIVKRHDDLPFTWMQG
jgi:hypothetical protein